MKKIIKQIAKTAKAKAAASSFGDKVREVVRKIPKGKLLTYAEVARRAGNAKAVRAVGSILAKNFDPKIPCHRVIRSDGGLGGYNRGLEKKLAILKKEGALR
ncbi:MAG: methylated-DNA-[protein]-cysteine S-methyltransferase [Candidatus Taylorbacteria bacterium]|nr:methylated-DNA-[protein]-cysteine S-methyltransferase [Candidatus Taylorbacteria bacterium]